MAHDWFYRPAMLAPGGDLCWTVCTVWVQYKSGLLTPNFCEQICVENPFPCLWKKQEQAKTFLRSEKVFKKKNQYGRCETVTVTLLKIFPTCQKISLISRPEIRPEGSYFSQAFLPIQHAEVCFVWMPWCGNLTSQTHILTAPSLFYGPGNSWVYFKRQNTSADNLKGTCLRYVLLCFWEQSSSSLLFLLSSRAPLKW